MGSSVFLPIVNPAISTNTQWDVRAYGAADNFTNALAVINNFIELIGGVALCDTSSGSVTIDFDSPVLTGKLTDGSPGLNLLLPGIVWVAYEGNVPRFEFIATKRSQVEVSQDGVRTVTLSGPGTAAMLRYGKVFPPGYPSTISPPWNFKNQSRMKAWYTLFNECKSRGTLTFIDPLFTATKDSGGIEWPDTPPLDPEVAFPEFTPELNQDLLDLLNVVTGQNLDEVAALRAEWVMWPRFQLDVRPTVGAHLEGKVIFNDGGSVTSRVSEADGEGVANYVVVRDVYGNSSLATSAESVAQYTQIESLNQYNNITSPSQTGQVASTLLDLTKDERLSYTLGVKPNHIGRTVFRDYNVGDWVGVDRYNKSDGSSSIMPFRVMSISVTVTQDNYECELLLESKSDLLLKTLKERLGRILNRPQNGTLPDLPSPPVLPDGSYGPYVGTPVYGFTPVDGRWAAASLGSGGAFGLPPCVYSANEPSLAECPVGYFWLRRVNV